MFFHSWADVGRVALASAIIFIFIVAMLRFIGQRALAKMSGFDMVSTVTIGSIAATVALTRDITLTEGVVALATMLALQEGIRWMQSRFTWAHHAVREPPRVFLWNGELLEDRLRATHVSADEVRAAVRKAGLRSLSEARLVVLENDGEWSVVASKSGPSDESAFFGLPIPEREGNRPTSSGGRAIPASKRRLP
jgi:uncharacterized membrane protein YcaP (DUF421 family)